MLTRQHCQEPRRDSVSLYIIPFSSIFCSFTDLITFLLLYNQITYSYLITHPHFRTVIRLGEWDLSSATDCETGPSGTRVCNPDPAKDFEIEELIKHPGYSEPGFSSDNIALIRLARPITFNREYCIVSLGSCKEMIKHRQKTIASCYPQHSPRKCKYYVNLLTHKQVTPQLWLLVPDISTGRCRKTKTCIHMWKDPHS